MVLIRTMNIKKIYLSILRIAISFFFIAVPFNPYVGGMTLYLWFFLIFLDWEYLKRLTKVNIRYFLVLLLWVLVCFLSGDIVLACKIIILYFGVSYLVILDASILAKIKVMFLISCFWCIAQFVMFYLDPSISYLMGPKEISATIWGQYATPSFTNQYVLILLPRMSGLSREAGFFASLLAIMFLIRLRDKNMKLWELIVYICSYMFSLSKVSFSLLLAFVIYPFKNLINKIPAIATLLIVSLLSIGIAQYLNVGSPQFFGVNESVAHRLSSSYMVVNMYPWNLFFGCDDKYQCFYPGTTSLVDYLLGKNGFQPNTGVNGVFINLGVLGFFALILTTIVFNLKSFDILIMALVCSTVTQFTIDGFVILTYYYMLTNSNYSFPSFRRLKSIVSK